MFTRRSFAAVRKHEHTPSILLVKSKDLLRKANDESVAARCKRMGLTPKEAKEKARELAVEFHKDPEYGKGLTYLYWTSCG